MKNNSILKSLVLVKTTAKRTGIALLLGFATLSLTVGDKSSPPELKTRHPHPSKVPGLRPSHESTRARQTSPPCFRCLRWRLASDGFK
jgi:hypothetical protein